MVFGVNEEIGREIVVATISDLFAVSKKQPFDVVVLKF